MLLNICWNGKQESFPVPKCLLEASQCGPA